MARPRAPRAGREADDEDAAPRTASESARKVEAASIVAPLEAPGEGLVIATSAARPAPGVTDIDPRARLDKGVRVRVLDGPFAGRTGVIQAFDAKGAARVALGALVVQVDRGDLVAIAEGRDRPALPSSHRKRPPAT